jgi:AcrR family transcriptional regulator
MQKRLQKTRNSQKERPISREKIEECAIELFRARGSEKTSISEIAHAAGMAKGTFYLYFKDKDALVDSVISRYAREFMEQVVVPNSDVTRLVTLSAAVIAYFKHNHMFLIELRKNLLSENLLPSTSATVAAFSQLVVNNLNQYKSYPIKNWEVYTQVILGMVLDVCYKAIIEDELGDEAQIMMSDFLKRFFSCE